MAFHKRTREYWDWSKGVTFGDVGTIKPATDTGWIQMSINTANAPMLKEDKLQAERNGDQVLL
ncbi:hypothetical protein ABDI49_21880 [Bacillus cereus]